MRVNMVPRDGGNIVPRLGGVQLRRRSIRLRQLRLARHRPALHALEPERQQDVQSQQHHHQRRRASRTSGTSIRRFGGPILRNKVWFNYTFRHLGSTKTKADAYATRTRRSSSTTRTSRSPASTMATSSATRAAFRGRQLEQGQALGVSRQPAEVSQSLGHRVDHSARGRRRAGDADQLRERHEVDAHAHQQAAARSRLRYVQPGIHRALSAERDRPRRTRCGTKRRSATRASTTWSITSNNRQANAWTESRGSLLDPAHVHGRGVVRRRARTASAAA